MLIDSIDSAQKGNQEEMAQLVERFTPVIQKYGRKLTYEDAFNDLILDFIILIQNIDLKKLNNSSDGAIVNYIVRSVYTCYLHRLKKYLDLKHHESSIEDLTPNQQNFLSKQTAIYNNTSLSAFIPDGILSQQEMFVIISIYEKELSAAYIAKVLHVSRQNVNQIKKKAERKLRKYFEQA